MNPTQEISEVCKEHSELFAKLVLEKYNLSSVADGLSHSNKGAISPSPVVIENYKALTQAEVDGISQAYASPAGFAYFVVKNADALSSHPHPLFEIVSQLKDRVPTAFPLVHPMEGHSEAVNRFGPADGTVKIYDLPGKGGSAGYREQAETNEVFDVHHDGLGSGGTVQTVLFYMDSPPLFGGYNYFLNVPLLALPLAHTDSEAFQSLFLPDALSILRPRGKGAIKVTTPVLFVNDAGLPQSFFRVASGEYGVNWRRCEALDRAKAYLEKFVPPFSPGTCFVHLMARGHGCIMDNQLVAHGRTGFCDDPNRGFTRVLSRKWFMRSSRDGTYKHVAGMFINSRFSSDYSSICDPSILQGEWLYEPARSENVRVK